MGFGHIFIYCTSFRYIFLQVFQQAFHQVCPETWRIDSEWNSRRSLDPDFLGRKSVDHFFFGESFPSTFEEFAGSFCFVFGSSGGCKSETLEETSGKIFLELPNLSWSNLPPSQVALVPVKVWWVPHPMFLGLSFFFFLKQQRRLHFGIFFFHVAPCLADPCGNLPGVVPGYENKQLYLEDEAVPPLKIPGLTTTFGKPAVSPPRLEAVSWKP